MERFKDRKVIAVLVFVALFVIGALFSFLFGRSQNTTNRASSPITSQHVSFVTKTVNPSAPISAPNTVPINTVPVTMPSEPKEGQSKIQSWEPGSQAPTFNIANGVNTEAAPLASSVFSLWYPNFVNFVNNFGKTYTQDEVSSWSKRVDPYLDASFKPYVDAQDPNSIPEGTPQSFYVLRASNDWITLHVIYDTGAITVTMVQNASNPKGPWGVQQYSILINGGN